MKVDDREAILLVILVAGISVMAGVVAYMYSASVKELAGCERQLHMYMGRYFSGERMVCDANILIYVQNDQDKNMYRVALEEMGLDGCIYDVRENWIMWRGSKIYLVPPTLKVPTVMAWSPEEGLCVSYFQGKKGIEDVARRCLGWKG